MAMTYLERNDAPRLAYDARAGDENQKTVIFLHGLWSDRNGTKALFLEQACARADWPYIRFDFRGHGESGGDFRDATIGGWFADALDVIDRLTAGPVILVGSSMGGWVSLLAARARPERVAALVGLAAAADFTANILPALTLEQRRALNRDGFFHAHPPSTGMEFVITRKLLEDGAHHCLLPGPIDIRCPVRLMQGMKDTDVPWQTAHRIANAIPHKDVEVYLREEGDHRLSSESDLTLLEKLTNDLADRDFSAACI